MTIIAHNLIGMATSNQLKKTTSNKSKLMERLSSGKRINSASDDAAGLSISEKMQTQINGLEQAQNNVQDGSSLVQTAEGGLSSIQACLQRMRTLSVQAASDTLNDDDRNAIQKEIDQLSRNIDNISNSTNFNGITLLDGSLQENTDSLIQKITFTNQLKDTSGHTATASTKLMDLGLGLNIGDTVNVTPVQLETGNGVWGFAVTANSTLNDYFSLFTNNGHNETLSITNGIMSINVYNHITDGSDWSNPPNNYIDNLFIDASVETSATPVTPFNNFFSDYTDKKYANNAPLTIQTGAESTDNIKIALNEIDTSSLGISGLDVSTANNSIFSISLIDNAIKTVSTERSSCGAYENTLKYISDNLSSYDTNLTVSYSRIEDADIAKELIELNKNDVLEQAAESLLSQANQAPNKVLSLLEQH